ncbi:murein lytic transglycosylase YjbJ [Penicillium cinerascens]|uniref:Murein lytic transglycosylase YjbJ n=1 Tax=Penicillium cinerascens TaxID=70096 RepID=A0A9W9TBK2_9EURO|nr:murein lytic transglycosylase YjbJ [Penicillium cinerascens]KAJ5216409.1 murein lytic transglycosylase YjbJ [Penicillium cinerascens]
MKFIVFLSLVGAALAAPTATVKNRQLGSLGSLSSLIPSAGSGSSGSPTDALGSLSSLIPSAGSGSSGSPADALGSLSSLIPGAGSGSSGSPADALGSLSSLIPGAGSGSSGSPTDALGSLIPGLGSGSIPGLNGLDGLNDIADLGELFGKVKPSGLVILGVIAMQESSCNANAGGPTPGMIQVSCENYPNGQYTDSIQDNFDVGTNYLMSQLVSTGESAI